VITFELDCLDDGSKLDAAFKSLEVFVFLMVKIAAGSGIALANLLGSSFLGWF
jgi:hypothetical protein